MPDKIPWQGTILSVQPRIRLTRSYDQRSHTYLGYVLRINGTSGDQHGEFLVGVGKGAQAKHRFQTGHVVRGLCEPVADPRIEPVDYYKVSKIEILSRAAVEDIASPPWQVVPPELSVYRERGHRRLDTRTYNAKCMPCMWGCRMAVEMIIDQWKPDQKEYRTETFCYGPKSCSLYNAGPNRKVPGRKGMVWEEPDWIDNDATSHRGPDV